MIKRLLSSLLAFIIVISVMPISTSAKTGYCNGFDYTVVTVDGEECAYLTGYRTTSSTSVTTPAEVDGYPVIGLSGTFKNNKTIYNITISEGVRWIGAYTFENVRNRQYISNQDTNPKYCTIKFPNSLKLIGQYAFKNASIYPLELPEGLETVMNYAFSDINFYNRCDLILPDSLKHLGKNAFYHSQNIKNIHLGKSTQFWDLLSFNYNGTPATGAPYVFYDMSKNPFSYISFSNCTTSISVNPENPYYTIVDGFFYTKDMKVLISAPPTQMKTYDIDEDDYYEFTVPEGVETIVTYAFDRQQIKKLTLSSSTNSIFTCAFYQTPLEELIIPDDSHLTTISVKAFAETKLGGNIIIPKTVKYIYNHAFSNTEIESLGFEEPSRCETIGAYAFSDCKKLKSAFIPSSVNNISMGINSEYDKVASYGCSGTFSYCTALEELTIGDNSSLTEIGTDFITGCTSLRSLIIGKNSKLTEIEASQIDGGSLEKLDLSNCTELTRCKLSFTNSQTLKIIDLGNTKIDYMIGNSFKGNTGLEKVILPDNLIRIYGDAFSDCTSLSTINLDNAVFEESAFSNCPLITDTIENHKLLECNGMLCYRYSDHITIYKSLQSEAEIVIPDEINGLPVTAIGDEAFYRDHVLTSVTLPSHLEHIGKSAFNNCWSLKTIPTLPDGVKVVEEKAFYDINRYDRTEVDSYVIPDSVEIIGEGAFSDCDFKNITIGSGVKSIDNWGLGVFTGTSLRLGASVENYDGVTKKYSYSFSSTLEEFTVDENNPYYTAVDGVLYSKDMKTLISYPQNKADREFTIPSSVESINSYAFAFTNRLQHLIIGENVKELGAGFMYRTWAGKITFYNNVTRIPAYAFYQSRLNKFEFFGNNNFSIDSGETEGTLNIESLRQVIDIDKTAFSGVYGFNCYYIIKTNEKAIEEAEFKGEENLEKVVIGGSVEEIKSEAFANCSNLNEAIISDTVKTIDDSAFDGCDKLTIISTASSPAILFAIRNNISYRVIQSFIVAPIPDQLYTGKPVTPALSVTQGGETLTLNKDYRAVFKNNTNIGTASVHIVGIGDYQVFGTTVNFKIVARKKTVTPVVKIEKVKITKLKRGRKKFTLKWKKLKNVSGYQIQYSLKKSYKKSKTRFTKGKRLTVRKLRKKKTYYVRIRAYKDVNGKRYFGAWTSKKIKVK